MHTHKTIPNQKNPDSIKKLQMHNFVLLEAAKYVGHYFVKVDCNETSNTFISQLHVATNVPSKLRTCETVSALRTRNPK